MKHLARLILGLSLIFGTVLIGTSPANATGGDEPPCVPKDAYIEVIVHEAVTHIEHVLVDPGSPAIPAVPGFWTNFQPNNQQETFVGAPSYPTDPRGTWGSPNVEGGPQQDASGVYPNGNPDKGGNWFYREQGTPEIPAVPATYEDRVIVDVEAYTEEIPHEAVTCEPPTHDECPLIEGDQPEGFDCDGPPEQPADKVEVGDWVIDTEWPCDATTTTRTRTVTTTPYVLVEGEWILGQPVVVVEEETIALTDAQQVACPPEEPPVTPETPVVEEQPLIPAAAATASASALPNAGGPHMEGLIAGLALVLAGVLTLGYRRRIA